MNAAKFEAIQADMHQMNDNIDKKISHVIELLHNVMENYGHNTSASGGNSNH